MTVKALLALALASVPVPVAPAETLYVNYPQVAQVRCLVSRGTAFEHVTTQSGCFVDGRPIVSPANEKDLDFSIIGPANPRGLKIDCGGFKKDQYYYAVGYADGLPIQRLITLKGTGESDNDGMAVLFGSPTVIPGMSGGPILNSRGEVVGTVNMYSRMFPLSLSRPLKDTSLCRS